MAAERGRAPNTLAAYRRDLTGYCAWLERTDRRRSTSIIGSWSRSWSERRDRRGDVVDRPAARGDPDAAPLPVERGRAARRPRRRPRGCASAGRHPQAAHRGRGDQPPRRRGGHRPGVTARPGAARVPVRHRGPHQRGVRAVARRPRPRPARWCGCSARAPRSGSCRSVDAPPRRSTTGLAERPSSTSSPISGRAVAMRRRCS